ncbi:hypothetical protein M9H77_14205 [Catharanthus roseus]|uniref:Uncharacterized protein n=1 Tax=Catharanthus roseus TaxID=4058 RepID=A0ACC0BMM4_CATRO|nr:hypothetical protein M9H77_14205 [Catharanthus roseus]
MEKDRSKEQIRGFHSKLAKESMLMSKEEEQKEKEVVALEKSEFELEYALVDILLNKRMWKFVKNGVSYMADLIGGQDDDVEEDDHFINDEVEWESEDEDNQEEPEYESNDYSDS